jgi:uncharacterized protein YdiU (UPF0061 family)
MNHSNPKYTWREWLIMPAYQQAEHGEMSQIKELQQIFSHPYEEQLGELEMKYNRLKPQEFFSAGGVSQYSCSS